MVIAGGGIGGLAAALACHRAGCDVSLCEQAHVFSEVGAGLQLGPNAVRVLDAWGLGDAARRVAARPLRLQVLDATSGQPLGGLRLGDAFRQRYRTDYLTFHRADLLQVLLQAVQEAGIPLHLQARVSQVLEDDAQVRIVCEDGRTYTGEGLIGCDGVWSQVRQHLLGDGRPVWTGHLAYRTLLVPGDLPAGLARDQVTVWLGPQLHAVAYPVRGGELFNLVVVIEGQHPGDPQSWDHEANGKILLQRLSHEDALLRNLVACAMQWKLWMLHDRDPVQGAHQMARGRIALLGDASHAMRPYQAQGAGMALEDAGELEFCLVQSGSSVPEALQRYAQARWQRNAWVQQRSRRNGRIFHADGLFRWARNIGMWLGGESLLDSPVLYGR